MLQKQDHFVSLLTVQATEITGSLISWLLWVTLASMPMTVFALLHCSYLLGENRCYSVIELPPTSWEHPILSELPLLELPPKSPDTKPDPMRSHSDTFPFKTPCSPGVCCPSLQWVDTSSLVQLGVKSIWHLGIWHLALIDLISYEASSFKTCFFLNEKYTFTYRFCLLWNIYPNWV